MTADAALLFDTPDNKFGASNISEQVPSTENTTSKMIAGGVKSDVDAQRKLLKIRKDIKDHLKAKTEVQVEGTLDY